MERSNLFVLSIVAVVAVVGLLTVFLQGGVGTPGGKILAAEKGNIEGQAIRGSPATSVARAPPRSPSLVAGGACPSCSLVWVDPGELVSKFGAEIRTDGRAPDYVCTELEYGGCFAGQTQTSKVYYKTTDRSCRDHQMEDEDTTLTSCRLGGVVSSCMTASTGAEPWSGDQMETTKLISVICIR